MAAAFTATDKQAAFVAALRSNLYRQMVYGGAVGGGKSYLVCALLLAFCREFPGSRWALTRKDLPTMRRNTIPTYKKLAALVPGFVEPINQSEWVARCSNGSEIVFFTESIKDDPDLDRWKGLEVNGFFHEEMNEISERAFYKSIERAGRWSIADLPIEAQPPPLIIGTCNPSKNWVKSLFYDPWKNGALKAPRYYLPAYVTDNPHLSAEYVENLKQLPPNEYKRFVEGNWDLADEPDQLIRAEWVDAAIARAPVKPEGKALHGLGVDVARYGDDETVIAERIHWHLARLDAWQGIDTAQTASITAIRAAERQIDGSRIRVDTVGLGAGVADTLFRHHRIKVTEFIAGAKPVNYHKFLKFKNLRSEQWWHLREQCQNGPFSIDPEIARKYPKLAADLTAPKYSMDSDKVIEVEPKDSIKARLGRSTDYGDAVVQCFANMGGAAQRMQALSNADAWGQLARALG
jgi:phage terminase large subunit